MLVSITRRDARLDALCEGCELPLVKDHRGQWLPAPPLAKAPARRVDGP